MAVLTTALARLRADFNTRFPNRDHTSDGWIGDAAHQREISGHNPDETGGGEYEDADSKDEVRAIDVDVDFREPGITAQEVVDSILATPADLTRLKYIIYNRRIWSRNTSWKPRAYTGSNPHDKHIHFSGDPAQDENAAPFRGVLEAGRDFMAGLTDAEQRELLNRTRYIDARVEAIANLRATISDAANAGFPNKGAAVPFVTSLKALLAAGDDVDEAAIVAGVLAGLPPAAIAQAIPADLARQVADELAGRLAS